MRARSLPDKFLVAFSFAGERRDLVRSIAAAVENELGYGTVFFDEWFEHYIAGDDADLRLQDIYLERSMMVVPCVSEHYGGKPWTRAEHRAIRAFQMRLDPKNEKSSLRSLPLRVGDGNVDGIIFTNTIVPDARNKSVEATRDLIVGRLRLILPRVFLAECTPDLEGERSRMKSFLEGLGWMVLPVKEYPTKQRSLLEQDLRDCLAFVQLLGPAKCDGFDRIQNETAELLGIRRFRRRSPDIDLRKIDPSQAEFLTASDVTAGGFEDFKTYLQDKLTELVQRKNRSGADGHDEGRTLVRSGGVNTTERKPTPGFDARLLDAETEAFFARLTAMEASLPRELVMPYPGLRPYDEPDAPLFFGREAQTAAIIRHLEDQHFVAVVGSSGCGKSSLVRAGLVPAVRAGLLLGTANWLILPIRPGNQPYRQLAGNLISAFRHPEDLLDEATLISLLRLTDRGLLIAISELRIPPQVHVMVIVDQFEELFGFRRWNAKPDEVTPRDEAAAFVKMLLRSCADPASPVHVVVTMRSDFIGDCEAFLGFPEAVSGSQFLVPRLDRSQMEEAIRRPSERGIERQAYAPFGFEGGLVNRIINDAGDRPDQLPLMQHALMRTWKLARWRAALDGVPIELKHIDYEKVGGIERALSLDADAAYDEIKNDPRKAEIARRVFLLLCDVSPDGQITRRRPKASEVESITGEPATAISDVVRAFQNDDRNFLLPRLNGEPLSSDDSIDISHEALLRQWQLFANDWLVDERNRASELRRLAEQQAQLGWTRKAPSTWRAVSWIG